MEYIFLSYAQTDAAVGQQLKKDLLQIGRAIRTDESYTPGSPEWREYINANVPDAACVVMIPTLTMGLRAWLWIEELARLGPPIICVFRIEEDYVVVRSYHELRLDTARASKTSVIGEGISYQQGFKLILEKIYSALAADEETGTIPRSLFALAHADLESDDAAGDKEETIILNRDLADWDTNDAPSEMDIQLWLEALRERHMNRPGDIPTDAGYYVPDIDTGKFPKAKPERKGSRPPSQPPSSVPPVIQRTPVAPPARNPLPAPDMEGDTKPLDYDRLQAQWRSVTPQFTAFWPQLAQPAKSYSLTLYVHREDMLDQIRDVARGFSAAVAGRQVSGAAAALLSVDAGSPLTIVPQVSGLRFDPPAASLIWNPTEAYQSATFVFTMPDPATEFYSGWVLVYEGPIILGKIDVNIRVPRSVPRTVPAGETRSTTGEGQLDSLEVFASYSHRDTPIMDYFRRVHIESGQRLLMDVYELRAGEEWNLRLLQMIDSANVFQLFWSRRSAESSHVAYEWRHALQFLPTRPRFIQPVWWEEPMEPPPPELSHLHFQRVDLPVGTQVQLTLSRLRKFINRRL